jgi:hypothetical protein
MGRVKPPTRSKKAAGPSSSAQPLPKAYADAPSDLNFPSVASLPDGVVEQIFLSAAPLGGAAIGPLLLLSKRCYSIAAGSEGLWNKVLLLSNYSNDATRYLPAAYLAERLAVCGFSAARGFSAAAIVRVLISTHLRWQSKPRATVAALLRKSCACAHPVSKSAFQIVTILINLSTFQIAWTLVTSGSLCNMSEVREL